MIAEDARPAVSSGAGAPAMMISCTKHGERTSAIVCRHHVDVVDRAVGFVENSADPDDLQAWCDDCESLFLSEGDKTDEFIRFNNFALVCVDCYIRLRALHFRGLLA
jgi:hypothetical protein